MKTERVVITCAVIFAVFLLLAAVGGFLAFRYFMGRFMPPFASLATPSVVTGADVLSKRVWVEESWLGSVTDIEEGEFDPSPEREIGIAGSGGAVFVDRNGHTKASVAFPDSVERVDLVDVEGDGICEFLNRGGLGWLDPSLMDHEGATVWVYDSAMGVADMAAGDLDGDGTLEFVAGLDEPGGLCLLDEGSREQWQRDGDAQQVAVVDTDGDGTLEIVHGTAAGNITIRDKQGAVVGRVNPGPDVSDFSLCRWPGKTDREYLLLADDDTIRVFDYGGKALAELDAPDCSVLGRARGTPAKLRSDEPEYLAVAVEYEMWQRAVLYVYDSTGKLAYQEVLPDPCASIAAIPLDGSGRDTLLVGGMGRVWAYEAQDGGG